MRGVVFVWGADGALAEKGEGVTAVRERGVRVLLVLGSLDL